MRTLQQILIDSAAHVDLDAILPTGTELTTRSNYANQLVWDASAIGQFKEFKRVQVEATYTLASFSLPTNFKEFMVEPHVMLENGTWEEYTEIRPEELYDKETSDKYCYVLGNPAEGYTAIFNNLTANATLSMVYQRYPSGLATLADMCELSDPMYVVTGVNGYVLKSRSDDRFPAVDAEKNQRLQNMLGREMKTPGGGKNSARKTGVASYGIS